jgi:hypothetical protein
MQVWVTARAQTALLASGSPVSPSQTTMPTSPTPRLVSSVRDVQPVLGALPTVTGPSPAHSPRMSRSPSTFTPKAT